MIAIALAAIAMYLFTREDRELETSSLFVLIAVLVWFELSHIDLNGVRLRAGDVLVGFGNPALVTIISLVILARGLERTGALQPIAYALASLWQVRPQLAFLLTLVTAAVLSMFLNNTPVVAAILPVLVAVSLQAKASTSAILMPVGFSTIVGGMATTIGTSTNLLVVDVARNLGVHEFGMFEFTLPVAIVGSVAIVYLWLIAPRLLPSRTPPLTDTSPRVYAGSLKVNKDGYSDGRTLAEIRAHTKGQLRVSRILRGELSIARLPTVLLQAGDVLLIEDTPERLKHLEQALDATVTTDNVADNVPGKPSLGGEQVLAEVAVTRDSLLYRRSLNSAAVLSAFGILPLALHRPGRKPGPIGDDIADVTLIAGDVILVQGTRRQFDRLKRSGQVLVLDGRIQLPRSSRAASALVITVLTIVVAATGLLPISLAAFFGFGSMLALRCLTWRDAVSAIDRRIVMVIVASLALGLAMLASGAADYVAELYVALTGNMPVVLIIAGLILIMALLTEIVTNNAVAVLGTPIAVAIAGQIGAPAEPFVLAVLFGANMSYLTPIGYQTNLLVLNAGGYRFSDFFRVGLPLQLIMWVGLSAVLPVLYEL